MEVSRKRRRPTRRAENDELLRPDCRAGLYGRSQYGGRGARVERKRDEREENISLGAASLLPGNRASLITVIPPNAAAPSLPALAPAARPRRQCPPPIICFADRRAPFSTRPPLLHISHRTAPHAIRCSAQLPRSPLGRLRDAPSPTRSLTMISPHPSPSVYTPCALRRCLPRHHFSPAAPSPAPAHRAPSPPNEKRRHRK